MTDEFQKHANSGVNNGPPSPYALTEHTPAAQLPADLSGFLKSTDYLIYPDKLLDNIKATLPAGKNSQMIDDIENSLKKNMGVGAWAIAGGGGLLPIPEDACAVIMSGSGEMKQFFALSEGNLPGSAKDWDALVLMHENAHCRDFKTGRGGLFVSGQSREALADYEGAQAYYRAMRTGVVSDGEVPYAARAMRAEHVMMLREDGGYTANAILPLPGEKNVLGKYNSLADISQDIADARGDIYTEANHGKKLEVDDIRRLADEPQLLYETARLLLGRGDLNDNPAGKKFAENFVDGAQRYKQEKYGVQEDDIPAGKPAIVEKLEKQFAPVPMRDPAINPAQALQ